MNHLQKQQQLQTKTTKKNTRKKINSNEENCQSFSVLNSTF